jgi:hypothetical protein
MASEIKLGLGNPPEPVYLYVKNEQLGGEQYVWYKYIFNQNSKIPVYEKSLTGYISEVKKTEREFQGRVNIKLDIVISADELYVVRSGIDTNFAKSFLLAASVIEDFSKPVCIVPNPGNGNNVVFCSIMDAQTRYKYRRDWNTNADWEGIIASIQSKLSSNLKYDLDEEPSQDERVKKIRKLMDYSVDLIKVWLHTQNVEIPSQLPSVKVDELVKIICLSWAADKVEHPDLAASSYQNQVIGAIATGTDELTAIQAWMNYIMRQRVPVSSQYISVEK